MQSTFTRHRADSKSVHLKLQTTHRDGCDWADPVLLSHPGVTAIITCHFLPWWEDNQADFCSVLPLKTLVLLIQLIIVFVYDGNITFTGDSSQSSHSKLRLTFSSWRHEESRNLKQLICLLKAWSTDWFFDWLSRRPITWFKRSGLPKKCKQAITTEPFLPRKDQVQIQVELPLTFAVHILLGFHWSRVYLCSTGSSNNDLRWPF